MDDPKKALELHEQAYAHLGRVWNQFKLNTPMELEIHEIRKLMSQVMAYLRTEAAK